jgi:Glycosyl hydrolase family 63 C-terminal domain
LVPLLPSKSSIVFQGFLNLSGTGWMAMYTLNLLAIALELAREDASYEDVASKFWEHFVYIAHAMNQEDGFLYDVLDLSDGNHFPLKVRSMVGLIPLFAVETLEPELLDRLPGFRRRPEWFTTHRRDLTSQLASMRRPGMGERRLLSIVGKERLRRVLKLMLDENEFFSPYGIRALSRYHREHPYMLQVDGHVHRVDYELAESSTGLFGGNSNWRRPIWFPVNYLLIESLQKFHHYLGDDYRVEFPTASGVMLTLWEVAAELSRRLTRIFLRDENDRRPVHGGTDKFQTDPYWKNLVLFSRRQRRRYRGQPSDGMDWNRYKTHAAERGVSEAVIRHSWLVVHEPVLRSKFIRHRIILRSRDEPFSSFILHPSTSRGQRFPWRRAGAARPMRRVFTLPGGLRPGRHSRVNSCRGSHGGRCFRENSAAAIEPGPAPPGGAAG